MIIAQSYNNKILVSIIALIAFIVVLGCKDNELNFSLLPIQTSNSDPDAVLNTDTVRPYTSGMNNIGPYPIFDNLDRV